MMRIRLGLRLLLLIVALFAVSFAWIGARRELQRTSLRGQIRHLEIQRDFAAGRLVDPKEGAFWQQSMLENEATIASLRKQLGESAK